VVAPDAKIASFSAGIAGRQPFAVVNGAGKPIGGSRRNRDRLLAGIAPSRHDGDEKRAGAANPSRSRLAAGLGLPLTQPYYCHVPAAGRLALGCHYPVSAICPVADGQQAVNWIKSNLSWRQAITGYSACRLISLDLLTKNFRIATGAVPSSAAPARSVRALPHTCRTYASGGVRHAVGGCFCAFRCSWTERCLTLA
jgi:hypothetical protein